jgi:NAD(P)-dependent dehydrogenase (short-subunit alcohol dehydrogenase family)
MSEELKKSNININCIMPSIIDIEANRRAMPTADYSKWLNPHDLVNVVLFLCSDDAKVITGAATNLTPSQISRRLPVTLALDLYFQIKLRI